MKRLKLLGLVCLMVFGGAAALATSAFALAEVLPSAAQSWEGKNVGESVFETTMGLNVKCEKAAGEGTLKAGLPLGEFHIHFSKCKSSLGGTCTGLGETAGIILTLGEYHIILFLGRYWILFLVNTTHFSCLALEVVEGQVMCEIANPTETAKSHEFTCKQTAGVQENREYENDAGTKVKTALLTSTSEASPVESGELAKGTVEFPTAVALMN